MFSVRVPVTAADQATLMQLDAAAFGSNAFPPALTQAILQADATYTTCLFHDQQMIGFGTLYPIEPESMAAFCAGQIKETELRFLAAAQQQAKPSTLWYIPDVVIAPAYQHNQAHCGVQLFMAMLAAWQVRADVRYPAEIYALAYSPAGLRFAEHNGFSVIADAAAMADGFSLVRRTFYSADDVAQQVVRLQHRLDN